MTRPTVIAHVSDLHLGPLPGFWPQHWSAKRAFGVYNWYRKRRRDHVRAVFDLILADVRHHRPDHIAVSGDLINVGMPAEYHNAARWLADIGPPDHVTLVPGNHDIYTPLKRDIGVERWRAYMTGDADRARPPRAKGRGMTERPPGFPFLRRVGDVAIIGVNSAVPTPPAIAFGLVGPDQRAALAKLLAETGRAGLFRLVMIHHPPLPDQCPTYRALKDAAELKALLIDAGVELVVHGHDHRDMLERIATAQGEALVVGVASASMSAPRGHEPAARSALYRISRREAGWHLDLERRGLDPAAGRIVEIERTTFDLARPSARMAAPPTHAGRP